MYRRNSVPINVIFPAYILQPTEPKPVAITSTLVANPEPVPDGQGDVSFGYVDDQDFQYQVDDDLLMDLNMIQAEYAKIGIYVSIPHLYYAWEAYSMSVEASWIIVSPGPHLVEDTRRFLIVSE